MTKNGKNSQNMKNKYTNVYLIRPSMENGPNKYIYKKFQKNTRSDMKIFKYSNIQVFKYSSIQVFKFSSIQVFKSKWLVTNLLINSVKARDPVGSKNITQFLEMYC